MSMPEFNVYDAIGGDETIHKLVDEFYTRVEADAHLRAIFPDDLEPGKRYQYLFLKQYWGGDTTYSQERGHPRLRMRHNPYPITQELRDLWVKYMLEAMDAIGIQEPARTIMQEYFERGASAMVNAITHPTDPNGD
jgi:hemoglobin